MIKFSLCLDPVFENYDLYDRVKIAAEQGFDGVEFWDIDSMDPEKMRYTCEDNHIVIANVNCKGAWENNMSRPCGIIGKNMEISFSRAKELNALNILVLAGEITGKEKCQQAIITENLKRLAEPAEKYEIQVSLEPLNSLLEHKGHFLDSSDIGFEIIKCVDSSLIRLVYDIYHMQIMEGNIISTMIKNIELIGHIHSAGCPGRHEHFLGENDYPNILRAIDAAGYDRFVGSEYFPSYENKTSTADVLAYLKSYKKEKLYK
jgi:hydroxypyruvate isomerase